MRVTVRASLPWWHRAAVRAAGLARAGVGYEYLLDQLGLFLCAMAALVGDLVAPEAVLVVGGEGVDNDGHGKGEDEDTDDGAHATDCLACDGAWALRAVTNWNIV